MTLTTGDTLPPATLLQIGQSGPEPVSLSERLAGRRTVIFAVPGAYTPTCSSAHVPSFIRTHDALISKGVDEVICISVNDPYVMHKWGDDTGANAAGIAMLADADGAFTRAIGMEFTAPQTGLIGRAQRFAMLVDDGKVTVLHREEKRGVCEISGGENMLDAL